MRTRKIDMIALVFGPQTLKQSCQSLTGTVKSDPDLLPKRDEFFLLFSLAIHNVKELKTSTNDLYVFF